MRLKIFAVAALWLLGTQPFSDAQTLPNIVWVMVEDIGCDFGCYGRTDLKTPNFDRLAESGLRLERGYVTNPICSPSRSAMMTGMYQTTIGAQHHRSHRHDGYTLPEPVKPITDYLRDAGYYRAIGCGYGKKTDLNFQTGLLFDGDDWSGRNKDQPFFAHIQLDVTHRMYFDLDPKKNGWAKVRAQSPHPVDEQAVDLPPYFPDTPGVRRDWALYLDQVEAADRQMGEIMQRLEDEGIADNTLIIAMGDNGRCHLRGKGFLYEDGIHVPIIFSWPERIAPGSISDDLVSAIDLSAQVLAAAGIPVPEYMQGRAFLEPGAKSRPYVFSTRDRWDEITDKSRCVVGKRFKYIRNDMPDVPWDAGYDYLEKKRPMLPELRRLYGEQALTLEQRHFFEPRKPEEELYDLDNDPWELNNLALNPEYNKELLHLRQVLQTWEKEAGVL